MKRLTKSATQALTGKRVLSLWRISSRSRGRRQLWRYCRWIAGIIRAFGRTNNSIKYSVNLAGHPAFPREEGEIQGRTIGIYPEIKSAAATNLILADRGDPLRFKLQFKIFRILSMSAKLSECTTALSSCRRGWSNHFLPFSHLSNTVNNQAICWIAIFSGSRIMCWRSWQGWTWQPPPALCFFRTLRSPAWSTSPPSRVWDRCSSTRTTSPS